MQEFIKVPALEPGLEQHVTAPLSCTVPRQSVLLRVPLKKVETLPLPSLGDGAVGDDT